MFTGIYRCQQKNNPFFYSFVSAVCGVRFSTYHQQSAVCSLQSAVRSPQSAICSLQSAVCSLQSALCSLQSALCSLQSANVRHRDEVPRGHDPFGQLQERWLVLTKRIAASRDEREHSAVRPPGLEPGPPVFLRSRVVIEKFRNYKKNSVSYRFKNVFFSLLLCFLFSCLVIDSGSQSPRPGWGGGGYSHTLPVLYGYVPSKGVVILKLLT